MKLRHLLLALPLVAGFPIAVAVTASAQGVQIQTVMLGGNEVSPTGAASAGDPDGYGVFTATFPNTTTICYGYAVAKIAAPNAAHIHANIAGSNGGIVLPLAIPAPGNSTVSECITPLPAGLFTKLRNSPNDFYVNVHNGQFGGGAIRGQLQ